MRPRDIALSVALHALLVLALLRAYSGWKTGELRESFAYLMDIAAGPVRAVDVPPPPAAESRPDRPLVVPPPESPDEPSAPATAVEPGPVPVDGAGEPGGVRGGIPGGRPGGRLEALGPVAGDARLWPRALYIPEGGGRPISMDSVVRARLLVMADIADSLAAADSFGLRRNPYAPADWTFERNGRRYGVDSRGIHFGTFSIPTALLAFLPIPQGNVDNSREAYRLMQMRADLLRAAARSEAEDDFRRAVEQIRARRDRERQEERERRERERQRTDDRDRPIP